jgi:hypothetical protein
VHGLITTHLVFPLLLNIACASKQVVLPLAALVEALEQLGFASKGA